MALSTTEAEYMALASAAQEAIWLQHLVGDLGNKPVDPMVLYKTTSQLSAWPRIPNSMVVQNTSASSSYAYGNR